jgi:hypothetical protein
MPANFLGETMQLAKLSRPKSSNTLSEVVLLLPLHRKNLIFIRHLDSRVVSPLYVLLSGIVFKRGIVSAAFS